MANLRSATVLFAICSLLVGGKALAVDKPKQTGVSSERLDITFDYQRGGIASSQYAIWVEDAIGRPVPAGTYTAFLEGTLYWSTRVLYSSQVQWGGSTPVQLPVTVRKNGTSDRNKDMLDNVKITHTMAVQP